MGAAVGGEQAAATAKCAPLPNPGLPNHVFMANARSCICGVRGNCRPETPLSPSIEHPQGGSARIPGAGAASSPVLPKVWKQTEMRREEELERQ